MSVRDALPRDVLSSSRAQGPSLTSTSAADIDFDMGNKHRLTSSNGACHRVKGVHTHKRTHTFTCHPGLKDSGNGKREKSNNQNIQITEELLEKCRILIKVNLKNKEKQSSIMYRVLYFERFIGAF